MDFANCKICSSNQLIEKNHRYNLWECGQCGLVFCRTIFSEKEIAGVYDDLYNKSNQYEKHQREYLQLSRGGQPKLGSNKKRIINHLLHHNSQSFVEIGAGVGMVGRYLQHRGYDYWGVEIDPQTAAKASGLGLNIRNDDIRILDQIGKTFDAAVGFEVLEHLQDLDGSFRLLNKVLKKGGYLGFSVPNYAKIYNYSSGSGKIYQDPPPIHLNFFTIESLASILPRYGFTPELLQVRRWPYLNVRKLDTYKFYFRALTGRYHGPTILCTAKKTRDVQ